MGKTVVHGNFEWDEEKNKANIENHGMSFEEILPMFDDPLFWEQYDSEHSKVDETRYFGTAKINGFAVVVSSYTERERTRLLRHSRNQGFFRRTPSQLEACKKAGVFPD